MIRPMSERAETSSETGVPVVRCALGGALMGLANLVPGISGGTMLVACGIYTRFIDAVSDVTRLRLTRATVLTLASVLAGAVVGVVALTGIIHWALVNHRWAMFSLFIGLTLGGVPILFKMARPIKGPGIVGIALGVLAMGGLVYLQESGAAGGGSSGFVMLMIGGAAAASAMILPGVSGAFLLLLLGLYATVIGAIKDTLSGVKDADVGAVMDQMGVIVPIGLGVVLGVALVSNALRWVLHRYEKATLGFLLGLIVAAPLGLYPFREGVPPEIGDEVKGELVTAANLDEMRAPDNAKDWEQRVFAPSIVQIAGSLGLIGLGIVATLGIARLGSEKPGENETQDEGASAGG